MAKNIKFTYFDAKGRGELSRLILAHGKVKYEDRRVSMEEWPALKPSKFYLKNATTYCLIELV